MNRFPNMGHSYIPELNPARPWHILLMDYWILFNIVFQIFMFMSRSEIRL